MPWALGEPFEVMTFDYAGFEPSGLGAAGDIARRRHHERILADHALLRQLYPAICLIPR